jgi:hypothetical protein
MILFEGGGAAGKAVGTVNGARDRIAGQWTKGGDVGGVSADW